MLQSNRRELIPERFQGQAMCLRSRTNLGRMAVWRGEHQIRGERENKTLSALNTAEQVRNAEARDDPIGRP